MDCVVSVLERSADHMQTVSTIRALSTDDIPQLNATASVRVKDTLQQWMSVFACQQQSAVLSTPIKRRAVSHNKMTDDHVTVAVCVSALECVPLCASQSNLRLTCKLLAHANNVISQAAQHAIQQVIENSPHLFNDVVDAIMHVVCAY